ncbi:MAG: LysR family transcriptional regulator [Rhodobacteraceae bacterium]|nr:LysR family transcriptional regulator [Paracoccaceae bacterium]
MTSTVTLKQLETLYWITKLSTFERAARKLCTSQSAISKRIQDLEKATGIEVFDRSNRGARLTKEGEALFLTAARMLEVYDEIELIGSGRDRRPRTIKIGVTELTAITWLPRFIGRIKERMWPVRVEPVVATSRALYQRLEDHSIDVIIVPEMFKAPEIASVFLDAVENEWMAKAGLVREDQPLSLQTLSRYPILTQGGGSGSGLFLNRWLQNEGISLDETHSCDNVIALIGLVVAGLGVSYIPKACFQSLVDQGKLCVLQSVTPLPPVPYVAMYRSDHPTSSHAEVAAIATEVCDFTQQFQI